AARERKPSNSLLTAREIKDCGREERDVQQTFLTPGTLYVILKSYYARDALTNETSEIVRSCLRLPLAKDEGILCSASVSQSKLQELAQGKFGTDAPVQTAPALAPLKLSDLMPELALGSTIDFGENSNLQPFKLSGWGSAE